MARTVASKSDVTRRRIVEEASAAFREHGIEQVGVRDVMERAGLTRGGFYFHFADKEALLKASLQEAAAVSAEVYLQRASNAPEGKEIQALIEAYLSAENRDHWGAGCLVAALAGEAGRGDADQRATFGDAIATIVSTVAKYMPEEEPGQRMLRAGLLMSSMAGVLMVSRVLPDPAHSDALLAEARKFYAANFGAV
ncbi:MAG: TetR/AcrR family transcriptional regulator [Pseudomonadota bacterium]